jgi:hypothetical protein
MIEKKAFVLAEKARSSAATTARVKLGLLIVAGTVGGACVICMCALLLYRRHQKIQQTVFPAAVETYLEGCCEEESSDDSDLAQSEYSN